MKNQRQGSRTDSVRQSPHSFPAPATIDAFLTPTQTASTTHFLAMSRATLRGEAVDAGRIKPQSSKHFQKWTGSVPAATPSLLIPSEDQDVPALLPEIVEETRRRLAQQARKNRETRRAQDRARLHQLLSAATDEAAPDCVPPSTLQESRQRPSGSVRSLRPVPSLLGQLGAS